MKKKNCPNDITLSRFIENTLLDDEKEIVMHHFSKCKECLKKITDANQLLQDDNIMKWENIPISNEKARSVLEKTHYQSASITDVFSKNVNMIKNWVNSGIIAFNEWKNRLPNMKTVQYAYVPVRSDSKEMLSNEMDGVVKNFDPISLQFKLTFHKEKQNTLQIKTLKKDHSFNHARLYLKHKDGGLISSQPLMIETIIFEKLIDAEYIIEIIHNKMITFSIKIHQGRILL